MDRLTYQEYRRIRKDSGFEEHAGRPGKEGGSAHNPPPPGVKPPADIVIVKPQTETELPPVKKRIQKQLNDTDIEYFDYFTPEEQDYYYGVEYPPYEFPTEEQPTEEQPAEEYQPEYYQPEYYQPPEEEQAPATKPPKTQAAPPKAEEAPEEEEQAPAAKPPKTRVTPPEAEEIPEEEETPAPPPKKKYTPKYEEEAPEEPKTIKVSEMPEEEVYAERPTATDVQQRRQRERGPYTKTEFEEQEPFEFEKYSAKPLRWPPPQDNIRFPAQGGVEIKFENEWIPFATEAQAQNYVKAYNEQQYQTARELARPSFMQRLVVSPFETLGEQATKFIQTVSGFLTGDTGGPPGRQITQKEFEAMEVPENMPPHVIRSNQSVVVANPDGTVSYFRDIPSAYHYYSGEVQPGDYPPVVTRPPAAKQPQIKEPGYVYTPPPPAAPNLERLEGMPQYRIEPTGGVTVFETPNKTRRFANTQDAYDYYSKLLPQLPKAEETPFTRGGLSLTQQLPLLTPGETSYGGSLGAARRGRLEMSPELEEVPGRNYGERLAAEERQEAMRRQNAERYIQAQEEARQARLQELRQEADEVRQQALERGLTPKEANEYARNYYRRRVAIDYIQGRIPLPKTRVYMR
jgi:hypothetical protein